ncbi:MAG: UTP--glucose-1-phosphate uridylyltransferase [Patescibacteria group bacterium]|nr:UTP--glucose-1-phosphate uridylyltransferase [Patescibacteria group bacterium]
MSGIRKLIIPVAGLGTRFLPATKAQPKEMLPLLDKPIIQYIVEEAVRSGITDIILVTGKAKRAIEDHFDRDEELEGYLKVRGKPKAGEQIRKIAEMANFIYVRQKGPYGNGTPVLNARHLIGDEPFAVVWGDDIWHCPGKPHIAQMIEVFERYHDPVISLKTTDDEGTKRYGIVEGPEVQPEVIQINAIIEKPGPERAKTRLAALGGYVFTPDIFEALTDTPLGRDGELWLVDAIANLLKRRPIYGKIIDGEYYDTGNLLGWLKANVEFALRDPKIGPTFQQEFHHQIRHHQQRTKKFHIFSFPWPHACFGKNSALSAASSC